MALSKNQLQRVCLLHQGHKQCRYLDGDERDHTKFYCKKKSTEKKIIDDEISSWMKDQKDQGLDPTQQGVALGNGGGCKGFVVLKTRLQGYDVLWKT